MNYKIICSHLKDSNEGITVKDEIKDRECLTLKLRNRDYYYLICNHCYREKLKLDVGL